MEQDKSLGNCGLAPNFETGPARRKVDDVAIDCRRFLVDDDFANLGDQAGRPDAHKSAVMFHLDLRRS